MDGKSGFTSMLKFADKEHILVSALLFALMVVWLIPVAASGIGSWAVTASYPKTIFDYSCVVSEGFIYCVGGTTGSESSNFMSSAVYFASLSQSGVGSWTATTSYPTFINVQSCVVSGGFIYCVGGFNQSGYTSAAYFASLSSAGVGSWTQTTNYPMADGYAGCVVSGGYIYCVGGSTGTVSTSAAYFASLSSAGIGSWTRTTNYPTTILQYSCVVSGGYIYCLGGGTDSGTTSAVYFAPLSSAGIGSWSSTTRYPTPITLQSCVVTESFIYCVGGATGSSGGSSIYFMNSAVYFAPLSAGGVGSWTETTNYPTNISHHSCVASGDFITCIGGTIGGGTPTSDVYFAPISPAATSTQTVTSPIVVTSTSMSPLTETMSTASTQIPSALTSPLLLPVGQVALLIAIAVLIASAGTYLTLRTRQKRGALWKVCSSCGLRNRSENDYCAKCGTSLSDKTRMY